MAFEGFRFPGLESRVWTYVCGLGVWDLSVVSALGPGCRFHEFRASCFRSAVESSLIWGSRLRFRALVFEGFQGSRFGKWSLDLRLCGLGVWGLSVVSGLGWGFGL